MEIFKHRQLDLAFPIGPSSLKSDLVILVRLTPALDSEGEFLFQFRLKSKYFIKWTQIFMLIHQFSINAPKMSFDTSINVKIVVF